MRRITTAWLAMNFLAAEGLAFDSPMYGGTASHQRTSKPMSHGKRSSRPLDERKARRAKRRQRRAGR